MTDTKKVESILSCPFCGSIKVEICRTNKRACWVRCDSCGCDTESSPSRKKAIKNWNRRQSEQKYATIVWDQDEEDRRWRKSHGR